MFRPFVSFLFFHQINILQIPRQVVKLNFSRVKFNANFILSTYFALRQFYRNFDSSCRKERWVNVKFIQFNCIWIQGRVSANLWLVSANGIGSYSAMARLGNLKKKKKYSLWLV